MIRPTIVPITPALLPGLHQLFDDCNQSHVKGWQFNPRRCMLAVWKGEVVGFVASWWDGQPFAWIDLLLVAPKYRGQGVGVRLAGTMEALLCGEGVKSIRCVLDEDGEFAELLDRAGFTRTGTYLVMERDYNESKAA